MRLDIFVQPPDNFVQPPDYPCHFVQPPYIQDIYVFAYIYYTVPHTKCNVRLLPVTANGVDLLIEIYVIYMETHTSRDASALGLFPILAPCQQHWQLANTGKPI